MNAARDTEQRAALWLVRREEPGWSQEDQAALDAWLDESMAHKAAFWRLEQGWREADRIAALGPAMRENDGVRYQLVRWRPWAAAASLAALLAFGAVELGRPPPERLLADVRVATLVGGHRIMPLADGSKVELNTATAIRATLTSRRREVWLDHGEAYFEVAHLEGRPFVVHAGNRNITVLGTKFSVRRDGDKVTVSVVEGRVQIHDPQLPDSVPSAILTAGDVALSSGSSLLLSGKSEQRVGSGLAWRDGILVFDSETLADAAIEFNRYNEKRIVIGDPEVAGIRIGGTFQASNVDAFVRLLHEAYGLQIQSTPTTVKISS